MLSSTNIHIILHDLVNICIFHSYHPRAWKRAWATNHPKGDQTHVPRGPFLPKQSVQRHHDQVVNKLIREQLPTVQSGFRKHHSTNNKLFELTQAVCQAQWLSRHLGTIFLEKAFNTTAQWLTLQTVTYEHTCFAAQMDFQLSKG